MSESVIQRAFAGGEVSPKVYARADLASYQSSLRACRNCFVRKEGGVSNRAGLRFVAGAKVQSALVKLYRWTFTAANLSELIEAGHFMFRFYRNGAPITVALASLTPWDALVAFVQGDLVIDGGVAYYALQDTLGQLPSTNPDYWYQLVDDGTDAIYELPTPYPAGAFDS